MSVFGRYEHVQSHAGDAFDAFCALGGAGFCLGGTLAHVLATSSRVHGRGPDAVVSYNGSGIHLPVPG